MTPCTAPGAPRLVSPARAAALVFIFIVMVLAPGVRAQVLSAAVASGSGAAADAVTDVEPASIDLLVGRSAVVNVGANISRVSLSSPTIADAMVTSLPDAQDGPGPINSSSTKRDELFEFAFDVMIDGLEARLRRNP